MQSAWLRHDTSRILVMGLLDLLFWKKSSQGRETAEHHGALPPLRPIGHDDSQCPYCSTPLVKLPRKLRPCPHCGKILYPRKRPFDGKVVLFLEEELDELDEQRAIAYGNYESYLEIKARREGARAKLRKKFGGEPSESDVSRSLMVDDQIQEARDQRWESYRTTKEQMAEQLTAEGKTNAALIVWMEVAYLELNGANDLGGSLTEDDHVLMDRINADSGRRPPAFSSGVI